MKRLKNNVLAWLVPGAMAAMLTGGFLYLIPLQDRAARLEIPLPGVNAKQEPAGRLEPLIEAQRALGSHDAHSLPPAAGGLYKWTDAKGKVHYGDRPPEGSGALAVDESRLNISVVTLPDTPPPQPRAQAAPPSDTRAGATSAYLARQDTLQCKQVKDEIAWIDARMRQGYKARTGERLRNRRRDLVELRSQYCH